MGYERIKSNYQAKQVTTGWTQAALTLSAIGCVAVALNAPRLDGMQAKIFSVAASLSALAICGHAELNRDQYDWNRRVNQADRDRFINERKRLLLIRQPVETSSLTPVEPLPFFDLAQLQDADRYPTICVFGPMGSGKSTVMKWLCELIGAQSGKAFDIHADSWPTPTVAKPGAILDAMRSDIELIERLLELPMAEKRQLPQSVRILDEAPDTLQDLQLLDKDGTVDRWLSKLFTVTRKLRLRLIVGAVTIAADDLKLSASKRNTATVIFPGVAGIGLAMKDTAIFKLGASYNAQLREQLQYSLRGVSRPGLVFVNGEWFPVAIPNYQPKEYQPNIVDQLESCWQAQSVDRLSPMADALQQYLESRKPLPLRNLLQNFCYQGERPNKKQVISLLEEIGAEIIGGEVR